ncbi:unnamed protein product [Rotaria sordida]|uniref:Microtubule-associated protein Jupiter n=1 Tax=Rotaria sordida TaxID=392033 RepID=A0A814QPV7_9BILA|nr:unnamed protein product [Rotaria sordida]CAF1122007.1 unnamed protein product [Rotaria sordida]
MSNFSKDHPSIRVFAPPGGRTANIFGVPEPEAPMPTKKNHMESDIFGCKKDNTDSVPVKQTRNITNNIFGSQPEQSVPKSNVYSDKNKSTIFDEPPPQQPSNKPDRQRSNIFASNEPMQSTSTRPVSEKYKSSIFGTGDNDIQTKRQQGTRQGLRDPNASRMGYNPINGEPYSTKDGLSSKVEQTGMMENEKDSNDTSKTPEAENGEQVENGKDKSNENGHTDESTTNATENGNAETSNDKPTNGHSTAKNPHTSVRIAHPPGGRSNGPLW